MGNVNYAEILNKRRDLIILAVMILSSLLLSRNIYQKQMAKYTALKEEISTEKEKNDSLDRIILLNEKIKQKKEKSWNTLDTNTMMESIFHIGGKSQIRIITITPAAKQENKHYTVIPFSLNAEASYRNLLVFIKGIETFPMLWQVRSMSASSFGSGEAQEDSLLKVNLNIEAVYLK